MVAYIRHTWVASNSPLSNSGGATPITASWLNNIEAGVQDLSDRAYTGTAWTAWTPAVTASVTPPTMGTASSLTGKYYQDGKLVVAKFTIVFGSSGVAAGSGNYRISLPVNATTTNPDTGCIVRLNDSSATAAALTSAQILSATTFQLLYDATLHGTQTLVGAAAPWTWAAGDSLNGTVIYEAA